MNPNELIKKFTVGPSQLATAMGSGSVEVLATPAVAAMMENTAAALAQACLEDGLTTVGTRLALNHKAASPVGAEITVRAVLEAREGRVFRFTLTASDNAGEIADGVHERALPKKRRPGWPEPVCRLRNRAFAWGVDKFRRMYYYKNELNWGAA